MGQIDGKEMEVWKKLKLLFMAMILISRLSKDCSLYNKPGKVHSVPEYTEFHRAFFATRILKCHSHPPSPPPLPPK
jgi:hypothetical protein